MRVFIAEKPDLAKIISEGMSGSVERKNGYIIKGNDILTWCFGHLLSLDEPEAYGDEYKKWSVSVLPIPFKYCIKRDSSGKIDKGAKEQLAIIKELVNRKDVTEVVHCGDADEEGQLLVDEVLAFLKITKPVKRLLLHDLSSSAVAKEIKGMKSNSEYKGISESGYARSQADWLVGLSLTRSVSVMMNKGGVYSIGRVSTPILSLIVNRDLEREQHKVSYYYSVTGKFGDIVANYDVKENIIDENEAKKIVNECNGKDSNLVVTKSHKSSSAPLVYNLLKLQVDCAKLYNYKPEKVLEITQQLREKYRAITYNRSDCEYLPESIWDDRNRILDSIKDIVDVSKLDRSKKSKCFNDKNITAHFGIIPNGDKVNIDSMNEQERNIYELIAKRFAMQFMEDKEWDNYELVYTIDNKHIFKKTINVVTNKGWDDEEVGKALDISNGIVKCSECKYEQKETKAKPAYTMSTLLSDMCSIAKYVKDERIKKLLIEKDKDKKGENGGIGTPATRSQHIANLFKRGYVEEKGKSIISTDKGRELIKNSPSILTQPDLTALWSEQQEEIRKGELSRDNFLKGVKKVVEEVIDNYKDTISQSVDKSYQCPECKKGYMVQKEGKFGKFWSCSNYPDCKHTMKDDKGKPVEKSSSSKAEATDYDCPKCKKGKLVKRVGVSKKTNKEYTFFGCNTYPKCDYSTFADADGNPKF